MPRPRKSVPSYRLHKPSGQAVVTVRLADGGRRDVYLGPHGSQESREAYARAVAGDVPPPNRPASAALAPAAPLTVNDVLLRFLGHAAAHYRRPDGTPTTAVREFKRIARAVRLLYGSTPAASFSPKALQAVRQSMIDAGVSRNVINQRVGRVVRLFKWAASEELVPVTVYQALATVRGLQAGRTAARETDPVGPVPLDVVRATQPYMQPAVRAMVEVQLLTGARPGEVCVMRGVDLDTGGPVWLYRPGSDRGPTGQHKTAHHGHQRVIAIGPKAQEILRPFLKADPLAYVFSPRESMERYQALRRQGRKTPVQPSQACRQKPRPRRRPGERYGVSSYAHAVVAACVRAVAVACDKARHSVAVRGHALTRKHERPILAALEEARERGLAVTHDPEDSAPSVLIDGETVRLAHWHPNQLRHTRATEVRRHYGLEAAQVVLAHQRADVTQVYAERNIELAARIAAELG